MSWLPGPKKPGETVTLKLSYKWDDPQFADIERLRERTPFRMVNKTMLQALKLGSRMLLEIGASGSGPTPAPSSDRSAHMAAVPVPKATLSKAAAGLLDTYGGNEK